MKNKILAGVLLSACAYAWAEKDAIIMTVNGVDVPKSEFEYLFHKNSQQQLSPLSLDDYVEMFKIYKLKVADARAAGIDTLASFRREMAQYRDDLAEPYLVDSTYLLTLVEEQARRLQTEVATSHIMLLKGKSPSENVLIRQRLDSIRREIANGADFRRMAARFSQDHSLADSAGSIGYLSAGRFPYEFETAAYATPRGELSGIVESPVAYHILTTGACRPSKGRIRASHIMKMVPQNASDESRGKAKREIDSLYSVVAANPDAFGEIAKVNSDDSGSAVAGGDLSWFGPGDMVPEFEETAYSLSDGEISSPIKSRFGWHIIKRTGSKGAPTAEEIKNGVLKMVSNPRDPRHGMILSHQTNRLAEKHHAHIEEDMVSKLKDIASEGGIDSLFFEKCGSPDFASLTILSIGDKKVPVADFIGFISNLRTSDPVGACEMIDSSLLSFFNRQLLEAEKDWLYAHEPEYRNLLNEYRDGSLLYEISLANVWDKASKDKEGLEKYFNAHREKYVWDSLRAKGILVQVQNDSIESAVRDYAAGLSSDSIVAKLRKEFKGKAKIEKFLVEKGNNAMIDNLMFGAPAAKASSGMQAYFILDGRLLDAPEEEADVRGQVTSDYQAELESRWVEALKRKYPVKVNKKELKKME
ncbi:MAG: peptidylprolyl isomerase [Muribaculaceae bacterium]